MDYLYKFIMEKHSEYWRLHRRDNKDFILAKDMGKGSSFITKPISEEQLEMNKLSFEMELLTESFCYLAHRTKKIIQNNNDLYSFEGLKSFESKGVRDVRNQLIEHPEKVKDGRIFFQSFGMGGDRGPNLKPIVTEEQEEKFPDAGLETNSKEFKDNLEKLLDKVLA